MADRAPGLCCALNQCPLANLTCKVVCAKELMDRCLPLPASTKVGPQYHLGAALRNHQLVLEGSNDTFPNCTQCKNRNQPVFKPILPITGVWVVELLAITRSATTTERPSPDEEQELGAGELSLT